MAAPNQLELVKLSMKRTRDEHLDDILALGLPVTMIEGNDGYNQSFAIEKYRRRSSDLSLISSNGAQKRH